MILYPAIDLKDGRCVRLTEGRLDSETVFNPDPADQARLFEAAGFRWLHVVDLDGAAAGKPAHAGAIAAILATASIPVQVGGGVRSLASVEYWIHAGATRVILGTAAVRDPGLVAVAARAFPEQIAVAIDTRDGLVAIEAWAEQTGIDAVTLAKRMQDSGAAALIVTDIARDGLKTGVNAAFVGSIADAVEIPVIASGGVRSLADIAALKALPGRPVQGLVLGRALYDGDIDPAAALLAAAG